MATIDISARPFNVATSNASLSVSAGNLSLSGGTIGLAAESDPGDLPASGGALLVASAEWYQAVRPAGYTSTQFNNAAFEAFGAGAFNPDYSTDGAYIICGSGGHGHAEFVGGLIYDFTARTVVWRGTPGYTEDPTPSQVEDTNGPPYYELSGEIPAPPHPYKNLWVRRTVHGGGVKGSMIYVGRSSPTGAGANANSKAIHQFDADTGIWSRATDDLLDGIDVEDSTVLDPDTGRFYRLPLSIHASTSLEYFNSADNTIGTTASFSFPASGNGQYGSACYCEAVGLRLILHFDGSTLQALNLDSIASGWTTLSYTGNLATNDRNRWCWHEANGKLYARDSTGAGQVLLRLTPPGSNPLSNSWAADTVTLTGDTVPEYIGPGGDQPSTEHYQSLFYIHAYEMLGWVTAQGVAILNPS